MYTFKYSAWKFEEYWSVLVDRPIYKLVRLIYIYTNGKKKLCMIKNYIKYQYQNKIYLLCTVYC
jgi:hypothetical protein